MPQNSSKKYKATIIGSIITVICLATTNTFIVPMFTIIPIGLPLEYLFSSANYSSTSIRVLVSLILLFIFTGGWFYGKIKSVQKENQELNTSLILFYFISQLFIVHPLVFYAWATLNAGSAGDGQFIVGIVETFPISSVFFVIIGLSIDRLKNKKMIDS